MSATVSDQITAFIKGRFPEADIAHDQDIFSLGYVNSLFAMELVMFLEGTFSFTVPNGELRIDSFRTVDAMTALVGRQAADVLVG